MSFYPRLSVQRALLALIVVFANLAPAYADDPVETALIGPGSIAIAGMGEVTAVLSRADVALYKEIFALQEDGHWQEVKQRVARLEDTRLIGHVLAQRYLHPTKYRSSFKELRAWLADYADLPQARRLYRLAVRRMPAGTRAPKSAIVYGLPAVASTAIADPDIPDRSRTQRRKVAKVKSEIRRRVNNGWPTGALQVLDAPSSRHILTASEVVDSLTVIARGYFRAGVDDKALAAAAQVPAGYSDAEPLVHWWAGLAAWRTGRFTEAQQHFTTLAASRTASDWNVAAGAYWAARAYLVDRKPTEVNRWLAIGAGHPYTFYGLLSRRALALDLDYDWTLPHLDHGAVSQLTATEQGARAIALLQVGQYRTAGLELTGLAGARHDQIPTIAALASRTSMPALSYKLARRVPIDDISPAAMFPLPHWQPEGGFEVDRALVYGFIRQESSFNQRAKSPVGASGLMQLMPRTASFIGRQRSLHGSSKYLLMEPEFNISLGQRYLDFLLSQDNNVGGDLFKLAVAYNAGPGNLSAWLRKIDFNDDALMFIESLPSRETRLFVERVLSNFWIYRHRMGQQTPALDAVVAGQWPRYAPQDGQGLSAPLSIAY